MRKGDAASLITLTCHTSSGRSERLNMNLIIQAAEMYWLLYPPDIYSLHSISTKLTSSFKIVWL